MPNIKSAKKRVKVAEKKALANKIVKSELKTAIKKAKASNGAEQINYAIKRVDQAAAKNIFHKNKANRKKSQLAKLANAVAAE